ncbi:PREDICTED: cysteine-rich and transmembrane domain-containing protein A-like [Camelina sativa]|uniref:Cysteine-rich and transmembrane domain-containing protein A-like n=1 Tax=Camelina sativa TaxID=90675 RepID=A0ABM1Q867_CAMSA|nr:PREDICTED: cysteine-rich and transmembrane domain-containing protein A-like [Camelina sativa]
MTSYHVSHESNRPPGPSPLYQPIIEAPPPPYPPTRTRYQDYYGGYGQPHPPPLRPYRSDEYYGEGEYDGCFPFLRRCLTALCCCWFLEQCCLRSRY